MCVRLLTSTRQADEHFLVEGLQMPNCQKWFDQRYAALLAEALVLHPEEVLPMAKRSPESGAFAEFFFANEARAKQIVAAIYASEELEQAAQAA